MRRINTQPVQMETMARKLKVGNVNHRKGTSLKVDVIIQIDIITVPADTQRDVGRPENRFAPTRRKYPDHKEHN